MKYWLLKSEPGAYSWDDLVRDGSTYWDGVRNFQARNNLRAMKPGDQALFYHSVKDKSVVGVARITSEAYPDPTAREGDWSVVDVEPLFPLKTPVTLKEMRARKDLAQLSLIKQSRLSVCPVRAAEFRAILEMGGR